MTLPIHRILALASLFTVFVDTALAEESHLTLRAETSLTLDNNLFRLSSTANPALVIGKSSAAEQIGVTSLSLSFSTALGLQKFKLTAAFTDNRYLNFDYLNSTSYDYNATLIWSLTPRLHGHFSRDRKEAANSFSDYVGIQQSNLRTETSTRFDAIYEIDGPWRISTGLSRFSQSNEQALVAGGDHTTSLVEAGFGYAFADGSSVTFSQKSGEGRYLNRILVPNGNYDTNFRQAISDARVQWTLGSTSSLDLYLSYLQQTHPNYPQRDFSGLNSGVNLNWGLTGKTSLAVAQSRDFSSYATFNSNYSQTDRMSLGPNWQISQKSVVRLRQDWGRTSYLGAPTGAAPSQRIDNTRGTALSFYWQPERNLTFNAAWQNAARVSNQTALDYDSRQLTISAQYNY